MNGFEARLKRERSRLGLNQTELATLGGVQQHAQYQYEKGLRRPNADYLSAIATAGVDILYVLTGVEGARLEDPNEQRIISGFRALDARKREALLAFIEAFAEPFNP
ncbi:Helix-turn-helix domain-containing protein [Burkholderia cepacia]|uniref:XRE family transcriptional regulator n=1 Tax=Burkholderia cepacia TaxID=292 RepID=A0A103KQ03_BURCE|nr:helix-turn-helix transcriptional regulator [Burkholderia cepacia]KVF61586.1 XRE family transcriptional regulator [Burkholderia cepacia]KVK77379.1 XRE family transcriptional regulator [Burkholderia cepacia]KVQ39436.1 XRE family transcriptional regulator [Burkholderia cepacia]KVW90778.1 XRE family transcriptional regulator [Burkholderia cepacia]KVX63363.1 XRE family transcriptional regulator [Burkholderia cepacia]